MGDTNDDHYELPSVTSSSSSSDQEDANQSGSQQGDPAGNASPAPSRAEAFANCPSPSLNEEMFCMHCFRTAVKKFSDQDVHPHGLERALMEINYRRKEGKILCSQCTKRKALCEMICKRPPNSTIALH
jgi:hypothetical protein